MKVYDEEKQHLDFPTVELPVGSEPVTIKVVAGDNGFIPKRLVIPSQIGVLVEVNEVIIGGVSQFSGGTTIPGRVFSELIETCCDYDGVKPGGTILVILRNVSQEHVTVEGCKFYGGG